MLYADGRGVTKDDNLAFHWYLKAAESGDADAQYNVGFMYRIGKGVAPNDESALYWFQRAAEQSDVGAMYNLGVMCEEGRTLPGSRPDLSLAFTWYHRASTMGEPAAQYQLARMYEEGRGVSINVDLAVQLLASAAENGYSNAQFSLGDMLVNGRAGVEIDQVSGVKLLQEAANAGHPEAKELLRKLEASRRKPVGKPKMGSKT